MRYAVVALTLACSLTGVAARAAGETAGAVRFGVDEKRGGSLTVSASPGTPALAAPGHQATASWEIDLGLEDTPAEVWSQAGAGAAAVRPEGRGLHSEVTARGLRLTEVWSPWAAPAGLLTEAWLTNQRAESVVVGRVRFTAGPLSLGGDLAGDEFIYPPGVFQDMRGPVAGATPGEMGSRYIYGCLQATDKLMLPLTMIHDGAAGLGVGLACRNDEAVARAGVIGGDSGSLQAQFGLFRTVPPGGRLYLGKLGLAIWARGPRAADPADWAVALRALREGCVAGGIVQRPEPPPAYARGLQIAWVGPYCPPYATLDDISARLPQMAAGGLNALIIGGRTWYCPSSLDAASPDFLPILRDGRYSAEGNGSGGAEALRRLVAEAHRLGMKAFCWGPTLAGISLQSPEVATHPDWWIRKPDGELNLWYSMMAPPDTSVPGWRQLICDTVASFITGYGLDGCWLDSTWKDHGLNHQPASGWYGGPNGAKVSLLREIRQRAKALDPDFLLMAESGGAETASAVDLWYTHALGVFPLLQPEQMQDAVLAEEACRLEGVRPFGQYQVDPGPLGDDHPVRRALLLRDSYQATLFLINTLPRVPAYFTGDPLAGLLDEPALGAVTRRLIAARTQHRELLDGEVVFGGVNSSAPQVVRFWRTGESGTSLVLVNCGPEPVTTRLLLHGQVAAPLLQARGIGDILGQATLQPLVRGVGGRSGSLSVSLPGFRGAILRPIG
jgi:hypothetical protein